MPEWETNHPSCPLNNIAADIGIETNVVGDNVVISLARDDTGDNMNAGNNVGLPMVRGASDETTTVPTENIESHFIGPDWSNEDDDGEPLQAAEEILEELSHAVNESHIVTTAGEQEMQQAGQQQDQNNCDEQIFQQRVQENVSVTDSSG
ncbi:hypothetical protein V6N12_067054 [Hibiscus sabdariffa]|uniref:Uncharacterized protein n=1 Tax=Hibiscus sabdariffa TaxID=183260 RepID=A0ABR2BKR3_9ROSI